MLCFPACLIVYLLFNRLSDEDLFIQPGQSAQIR